jgi:hypothetical protein
MTRKIIGTVIIGVAITLAIASIPLLISGTDPITDKLIVYTSAYTGNVNMSQEDLIFYKKYGNREVISRSLRQDQLQGDYLFLSIVFMGLSIVGMVVLKGNNIVLKAIIYPTLIGTILSIPLGIYFSAIESSGTYRLELRFNWILFFVIFGIGVFISLISLGTYLQKNKG